MSWAYWLSGAAALVIFVYLIVALFRPEYFE
jgi:K+-transporting ATPase KdpF subunit